MNIISNFCAKHQQICIALVWQAVSVGTHKLMQQMDFMPKSKFLYGIKSA